MKLGARELARFGLLALAVHIALLVAWPLVARLYAPAYRGLSQYLVAVIDPLPGSIEIRFEPGSDGPLAVDLVRMDTVVSLRPRSVAGEPATFGASSFFHAYLPTAVLLALFAGTFRIWRGRRAPILWALAGLHLVLVLRALPAIFLCYSKCTIDGRSPLGLGAFGERALYMLRYLSWVEMVPNYLVPVLLFVACLFGGRSSAPARA